MRGSTMILQLTNLDDLIKFLFVLKLQSFTGIDDNVSFDVNIHENTFEPDQDALNEIETFMNGTTNMLEDFNINEKNSDDSSTNDDNNKANDDFTFEDNSSSHSYCRKKSTKSDTNNVATMSGSLDDDNSSDEDYHSHSSSDSSDDAQ